MIARRGLHADVHHRTENPFGIEPCRGHIDPDLGQELEGFHLQVRGRKPDGVPQALALHHRSRQTVRPAQISLGTVHVPVQKGVAHRRRTDTLPLVKHDGKHLCRKLGKRRRNGLVVALAAGTEAMVMTKEHRAHAPLFDQLFTDKFIKRESRQFLREGHHQEFKAQALYEFTFFLGGGKEQGISGFTEHVVGMGFETDDGGHKAVYLGHGLQGTEKRLVTQVASVKISHGYGSSLFHIHRHSFLTLSSPTFFLSSPRRRGSPLLILT